MGDITYPITKLIKVMCMFWLCAVCSVVLDSATLWTVTHQAPLSMGFSRQEYWSGLPFPSPGDIPDKGIEPASLVSLMSELACGFFTAEQPGKPYLHPSVQFSRSVVSNFL